MSYVAIWLQACLHWRCAYFQTLSWNDTIFVVDWDILYKLCGSANKWSKGFIFSGKIWWQLFSCNKACSKYHMQSTTMPKYTLPQRPVTINSISYNCIFGGWGDPIYFLPLHNKLNKTKISLFQIPTSMSESSLRVIVLPSLCLSFLWTWHSTRWNTQTLVHRLNVLNDFAPFAISLYFGVFLLTGVPRLCVSFS